ncbi:Chitin synthase, class 2, partial [Quaeritorhiza haematococci]
MSSQNPSDGGYPHQQQPPLSSPPGYTPAPQPPFNVPLVDPMGQPQNQPEVYPGQLQAPPRIAQPPPLQSSATVSSGAVSFQEALVDDSDEEFEPEWGSSSNNNASSNKPRVRLVNLNAPDDDTDVESVSGSSSIALNTSFNNNGGGYPTTSRFKPLSRGKTTLARRVKTVKLSATGNFVIKQKVPEEVLQGTKFQKGEEFETVRYTACTCDPNDFQDRGYSLRIANYRRPIELFIVVTMYNEDEEAFNRTMFGIAQNLKTFCLKNKWGWDADAWKKVAIVIVSDGRSKIHPNVLKVLEAMGVYQDGLAQAAVNEQETQAHIFEFTAQKVLDEKMQFWGHREGIPPMQIIFCLKEKNAKKINSHRWFFKAFCPMIDPRVCALVDVGTKPDGASLYYIWKAFFRNPQIAGACGEIRADLGTGLTYFKSLANPLVASQNFEYKISNLLDKALESVFGYISVLPGAFSAYRWQALGDVGPGTGPLAKYFEGEQRKDKPTDSSIFSANLYLAEDRILCFELVSKKNARWTLHYVKKAYADTDVPDSVPEFLSQRRRWLNGSLFAGFYALANIGRIWESRHSFLRKFTFTMQYIYNVLNQLFSWFILGNFAITFKFLFEELKTLLSDPNENQSTGIRNKIVAGIVDAANYSYPVVLICLFVISFGNRPQAFALLYKLVMIGFGLIGAVMLGLLVRRMALLVTTVYLAPPRQAFENTFKQILSEVDGSMRFQEQRGDTADAAQILIAAILGNVTQVVQYRVQKTIEYQGQQALTYIIALASTFGVFFLASFLQMDFSHMFTCLIQ